MPLPTGSAGVIHWFNTVWQLAEAGARVDVLGGISPSSSSQEILEFYGLRAHPRLAIRSTRPWRVAAFNSSPRLAARGYLLEMVGLIRRLSPQALYGIGMPNHLSVLRQLKRLHPFRVVLELHEDHCTRERLDKCLRLMRGRTPPLDGIVTVSPAHRDLLISEGASPERVHTFYAVHRPDLLPNGDRAELLAKLELPIDLGSPIVLYGGNLYGDRGVDVLLKAFAHVIREIPEAHLVVLGTGGPELESQYLALAATDGLRSRVHFTGRVPPPAVGNYLALADVGVVPNPDRRQWKYGSPIKLSEYLGAGLAVVATNLETSASLVGPEEAALLVRPDSPGEMAQAIVRLLKDRALLQLMREKALKVGRNLTYEARAESIYRFIQALIAG